MKAKLTDGRTVELLESDFNPVDQIYLSKLIGRGIAEDEYAMCELLGSAPCDIRYGMVHPNVEIRRNRVKAEESKMGRPPHRGGY